MEQVKEAPGTDGGEEIRSSKGTFSSPSQLGSGVLRPRDFDFGGPVSIR